MDIKCSCCNNVYVDHEGDVCFNCMLKGAKPSEAKKASISETEKYNEDDKWDFNNTGKDVVSFKKPELNLPKKDKKEKKERERTSGRVTIRGTVYDFKKEPDLRGQFERYTSALFRGTPYTYSEEKYIFNVKEDNVRSLNFDSRTGSCVVINGDFTFGSITNNDVVEVVGTRNKYGVVAAEHIKNISNGSRISIKKQISAASVRMLTFLAIALVVAIIYFIVVGVSGMAGDMVADENGTLVQSQAVSPMVNSDLYKRIGIGVVGLIMVVFSMKFGRMFAGKTRTIVLAFGAGLILYAVDQSLLVTILASATIVYVLSRLLKMIL